MKLGQKPAILYSLRLGRLAGVPVEVRLSWFLVMIMILLLLKGALEYYADWPDSLSWSCAALLTIMIFASIIAHEAGHALLARRYKVPVRRIVVTACGGLTEISEESEIPAVEFKIALAGPIASLIIGALFGLGWLLTGLIGYSGPGGAFRFVLSTTATANFGMAAFNLLPGLPLDGGRALRAAFWQYTGDYERATRLSGYMGTGIGTLMVLLGWYLMLQTQLYIGSTLIFSGLVVMVSATFGSRYNRWQGRLRSVKANQLMQRDFVTAEAQLPLAQLIRQHLLVSGYVLLTEGQQVVGVLDLADIKKVPSNTWWQTPASAVMTPLGQMIMVKADSTALHASNLMQAGQSRRVFILAEPTGNLNPEILGVLGQEHLHRAARRRMKDER